MTPGSATARGHRGCGTSLPDTCAAWPRCWRGRVLAWSDLTPPGSSQQPGHTSCRPGPRQGRPVCTGLGALTAGREPPTSCHADPAHTSRAHGHGASTHIPGGSGHGLRPAGTFLSVLAPRTSHTESGSRTSVFTGPVYCDHWPERDLVAPDDNDSCQANRSWPTDTAAGPPSEQSVSGSLLQRYLTKDPPSAPRSPRASLA